LAAGERLDLKLCTSDKKLLAQGVAIEGLSLAAFVRLAARQRAAEAIQREQPLALSQRDFAAFQAAISQPFAPNPALQEALEQARTHVSRV
jgi:uncharacterized protein (DUF1778 family)